MSFAQVQSDIADVIDEFGSTGTIISEVQSASTGTGIPTVTSTSETVKYVIDSNRKFSDPNSEQHPNDLYILIPGDISFQPDTDDVFRTSNSKVWGIRRVEPIEVKDVILAYTLVLQGTQ